MNRIERHFRAELSRALAATTGNVENQQYRVLLRRFLLQHPGQVNFVEFPVHGFSTPSGQAGRQLNVARRLVKPMPGSHRCSLRLGDHGLLVHRQDLAVAHDKSAVDHN